VVVINAEKIHLSGNKMQTKTYVRHTGYPGGQRSLSAVELMAKNPTRMVEKSIKGMLPKNKLGAELFRNLKVYEGAAHQQEAQKPRVINLKEFK
jgi:large subunit ribosomal protein L13